jgi:predicted ATPase
VLHTHLTQSEAEHFYQEAETIAKLTHPSIIRVFDFDVQDGTPFLVMDYAPHGSLRQRYPKGSLVPLPQVVSCVKQMAAALQYAHDKKYIHRDVKPENMLIGQQKEVLLSDFGIATIAHSTSSLSAGAEGTSGTLAYMAPEQIEGHPRPASDQYALGVVVYEWLCGERPFEGSVSELIAQQLSMPPPPLRERVPEIPLEVEQVVLRALAKDPKARFASVADFSTVLMEASKEHVSGQTLPLLASGYATEAELRQSPLHDFPPLKTLDTHRNNLPIQPTPFIGREKEVDAVGQLLLHREVHLVTLTGPGGVGKTRLAFQVAAELAEHFPDGRWFVSLTTISDPDLVIPAIIQTLGLREAREQSSLEHLKDVLQTKNTLLLLDNFEQVVSAAPRVADLLTVCPRLKVLITSREGLHLRAEREFPVPALALPDAQHLPDVAALSQYEAVALFIERAQAVKPDFLVTNANAPSVAEICTRLDGLPLAIELAAARIKLFPPQALLARLGQRLQLLTQSARDVPARQQTMRKTTQWSYDLLTAQEQRMFRRLSIFTGGCAWQAVEAVSVACGDETPQVLDAVASLIDKNLVQQTVQEGEEIRLKMLETIREYGLESLIASGEMEATQQAHAQYYLALVEEAEPELAGQEQTVWLERLEWEYDNLRAALRWFLERGEAGHGIEMALRLAGALQRFWDVRGHLSEGQTFLEQALAGSKEVAAPVHVKALKAAAYMAYVWSDYDRAEALFEECQARCLELGDTVGVALSLRVQGLITLRRYNFAGAIALTEESLALFREAGDKEGIAWSINNLASMVSLQGEYARAISLTEESLALFRALGNIEGISHSLVRLAVLLMIIQGDQATGRLLIEESLALCREVGNKERIARALSLLGQMALLQGDTVKARTLLEESLMLFREIGYRGEGIAEVLIVLGRVASCEGDHMVASALYDESLSFARMVTPLYLLPPFLEGWADMVSIQEDPAWAARLWGLAEAQRETMGAPISPVERASYDRSVAAARAQLGEKAFTTAWAEGRTMTFEQVLAEPG